MNRLAAWSLLVVLAGSASGCAMCCSPYDEAYGFTGGRWPRADLCHGRVGSAFAPAGGEATVITESTDLDLPAAPEPDEAHGPQTSVKKPADWTGDLSTPVDE